MAASSHPWPSPGVLLSLALAQNAHGEMPHGPMAKFTDNMSETLAAWADVRVLSSFADTARVWRPFAPQEDVQQLTGDFGDTGITALALDDLGYDAFVGRHDGKIACLDIRSNQVWHEVTGVSSVTALAANGDVMQAVRAGTGGMLDVWDLNAVGSGRHLIGHTDQVVAIGVDWQGKRAATASMDKQVILWDLAQGIETSRLSGHEAAVSALHVDWANDVALTGSEDETVRLWSLKFPADNNQMTTLEGHSDVVRFVSLHWEQRLALSVSAERTVKLWNLATYECSSTFREEHESRVVAVHVDWASMQALAVMEDGFASLWDLQDPSRSPLGTSTLGSDIKDAVISSGHRGKSRRSKQSSQPAQQM